MAEQGDGATGGGVSRRRAMQGTGAVLGVSAIGACKDEPAGDDDDGGTAGDSVGTTSGGDSSGSSSGESGVDESSGSDGSSSGGEQPIEACADPGDMTPEQLLANIDTIVVVMMENRSFDHYFGAMKVVEGLPVDGLTGTESNADSGGQSYEVFPSDYYVVEEDPPHGWDSSRVQFDEGSNAGFVMAHQASGATELEVVMGYHTREQLPVLYALADNYVLCDRWFCSVMGSTWPNRFYLHLGSSGGQMGNSMFEEDLPSIFDRCEENGISNLYYHSTLAFSITYGKVTGVANISQFFADAEAGTLPQVCYVDPAFSFEIGGGGAMGNDDHPPADIRDGQAFLASVYNALANSPQWDKCLLVITYDEHGGFYDHVPPPDNAPDERPEFRQLGFRVPSLVVGPQVRQGCVSSIQYDHVSVLSTITKRFGLPPLNDRVAETTDLSAAIDPELIDAPRPPISLPALSIAKRPTYKTDVHFHGQSELAALYDRLRPPAHLDRRAQHDEVMRELYDWGVKLGAIDPE